MLTERIISDLRPGPKSRIVWDHKTKGLGVRITPTGTRAFVVTYRTVHREQRRKTLCRVEETSLKEARRMAGQLLLEVRAGADPVEKKRQLREAPTVGEAMNQFFEDLVPQRIKLGKMTAKTAQEYGYHWAAIAPRLERKTVATVTREHIEKAVSGAPVTTRNRMLALLSRCFNEFEKWGLREQFSNPVRFIEKAQEKARDRVLTADELGRLAVALKEQEGNHPAAVAAVRVAALSGLRIGEVLRIRWQDLDLESGRLRIPESKTGARTHTLPAPALDVIRQRPRECDWVFTARRKAPVTYRYARVTFQKAAKAAKIQDVRLHDLRRTVATTAAASGASAAILRDLLGHRTMEMANRYVRDIGDPVTEMREHVGGEIAAMMGGNEQ
ncbi:MAG: site-specific integrase [Gemmatimonadetes bacterium]|nr:site-specific integrase [Gemmatimonadota bacterium]